MKILLVKTTIFILSYFVSVFVIHAQSWINVGNPYISGYTQQWPSIVLDHKGRPYVAFSDWGGGIGYGDVRVIKYQDTGWSVLGTSNIIPFGDGGWYPSLALGKGDTPYVAFRHEPLIGVSAVKYTPAGWELVGNMRFSGGSTSYTSLVIDKNGTPYVAFVDDDMVRGGKATVMKFTDTGWVALGGVGFSSGPAKYTSLSIDRNGTPYLAYQETSNGKKATVMKYDGSGWITVGSSGFSEGKASFTSLVIDKNGIPYVAYVDSVNGNRVTVMKFTGSAWMPLGNVGFTSEAMNTTLSIDTNNVPYVAYNGINENLKITVMKFDGTSWVTVGNAGFAGIYSGNVSLAISKSGIPYVVYVDGYPGVLHVMSFGSENIDTNANSYNSSVTISPNPTRGNLTLRITSPQIETATIKITNILGEKIEDLKVSTNCDNELHIDALPGIYFLTAITKSGTQSVKVMKN